MKPYSESGHLKNIASFKKFIESISEDKDRFLPADPELKLDALINSSESVEKAESEVNSLLISYNESVVARRLAFQNLNILIVKVHRLLKASSTNKNYIASARSYIHKYQGKRSIPKLTNEEKAQLALQGKTRRNYSASQTGYDNKLGHFERLVSLAESIPKYNPQEAYLTTQALRATHQSLLQLNKNVVIANLLLRTARLKRNKLLYAPTTGICDLTKRSKDYLRAIYGSKSEQYRVFRNIKLTCSRVFRDEDEMLLFNLELPSPSSPSSNNNYTPVVTNTQKNNTNN